MTQYFSHPFPRKKTVGVRVGDVMVGGEAPVVLQSMTNTDTADADATVAQVAALARAGSEVVRITVDRDEAAAQVPRIRERLALWRNSPITTLNLTVFDLPTVQAMARLVLT